ncbi:nucleotidyltransferase family protein [Nostoc sp.]|uniref:nucleotidyltransferase family protein n=1 Tax=Nostoc sp. TaxID=1180 RepID=UPI002FFB1195
MSDRFPHFGSYRLTPAQELLLQASLLKEKAALTAWEQWQSSVDIEVLDAESNVLLPQLYQNLLAHGVEHPHMARLKGIYRRNWYANQLRLKHLKNLLSHLKDGGIEAIVLGQAALYPCQAENSRPIDNFHLLIRSDQLDGAIDQLSGLNWQTANPVNKTLIYLHNHQQYSLYLQSHLFWAIPQDHTDEQVWHYATTDFCDRAGWRLSPTDQFLDGCARTFFKSRSRQIYGIADAMISIINAGSDLDWMRLITQAQRYQMILPVRNMLILLQQVLHFSAPSWVLPAIFQMPIAEAEWLNYQVLAGDRRSLWRSTVAQSIRLLGHLETQLLHLRNHPFPGRQLLKNLLKPKKSALE